jgi:TolB-like protein
MLTQLEKWEKLKVAMRRRLAQYEDKETKVKDPASKMAVQYAQLTVKDVIRIMNLLEEQ